ncbi:MAG: alpha-ketoglutarate-dependent dioxygenase AlkB [Planctomycetes bacterium]|nr:alpha-ketoglutarate-dependent dioxygenase AlkB [Planctomycetota bacterium]
MGEPNRECRRFELPRVLGRESWIDIWNPFFEHAEADALFGALREESTFERRSIWLFGREVTQPRGITWAGDLPYTYSRSTLAPRRWTSTLARLRTIVADVVGADYNHALLNLYRDGRDSMGMHSDDEVELGAQPTIVSFSFGATRHMVVRAKRAIAASEPKPSYRFELAHGDLVVMGGAMQLDYLHGVPKTTKVDAPRLNVTFRRIVLDSRS